MDPPHPRRGAAQQVYQDVGVQVMFIPPVNIHDPLGANMRPLHRTRWQILFKFFRMQGERPGTGNQQDVG
ncbi:MAG: hypothetical protein MUO62_10380 [Anaerolineales bacterium]|nr:hypothetical protein [Anaerolineales bacterium]